MFKLSWKFYIKLYILCITFVIMFSKTRMWSRVVWLERDEELEGVMPSSWVRGEIVMWPPGVNAAKAMKDKKEPQDNWRKFKLVKVKLQSGML